jgi:hypothetical protein
MASLPDGETLIVDRDRNTNRRRDANGTARAPWEARGVMPCTSDWPVSVAVTPSGDVIVGYVGTDRLMRVTVQGGPVATWRPPAPFGGPVAVEASGSVLVAEQVGNRAMRLDPDATTLAT